jgi:hypothetical protein
MDPETKLRLQKARRMTTGNLKIDVGWPAIGGLALRVAVDRDMDTTQMGVDLDAVPDFFSVIDQEAWALVGADPQRAVAWIEAADRHNAVYLELLVRLFARRLKYRRILSTQAFATSDQIGPRILLEHGLLDEGALASLIVWRKWMMDIDNRSGQETGYLYDAIVARALGGTSFGSSNSPISRAPAEPGGESPGKRQVDCVVDNPSGPPWAYEVKIRITDAASRQGRLKQELQFPEDCVYSEHVPRLLVFDPTPCDTLTAMKTAFWNAGGEVFEGPGAYAHIGETVGEAQAMFLQRYVAEPLKRYEDALPDFGGKEGAHALADLRLVAARDRLTVSLEGFEPYVIQREVDPETIVDEREQVPDAEL